MGNKKILMIVTGTGKFAAADIKTGLWLSEFTHLYHNACEQDYEIYTASPKGGATPVDPVSLKPVFLDSVSRKCWKNKNFRNMLDNAQSFSDASGELYDCVYLAGGHGAMFDFTYDTVLQKIIVRHYESDRLVCAICHGLCGLLNVRLSNGDYLVTGEKMTGFSWFEEILADRRRVVPFNLEHELMARGADYRKSAVPFFPEVVVDRNLITGQDPFSSRKMAGTVMSHLNLK